MRIAVLRSPHRNSMQFRNSLAIEKKNCGIAVAIINNSNTAILYRILLLSINGPSDRNSFWKGIENA